MKRIRNSVLLLFTTFLIFSGDALACPVCFGNKESAEVEGAKWAILFLLGVTGTVLSGVVGFIVYLRKRHAAEHDPGTSDSLT